MGDTCFIFLLTYNSLVDDGGVVRYKYFMLFVNILCRVPLLSIYLYITFLCRLTELLYSDRIGSTF